MPSGQAYKQKLVSLCCNKFPLEKLLRELSVVYVSLIVVLLVVIVVGALLLFFVLCYACNRCLCVRVFVIPATATLLVFYCCPRSACVYCYCCQYFRSCSCSRYCYCHRSSCFIDVALVLLFVLFFFVVCYG